MLYLYMGTFTINIPQMLPYMPNIRILVIEWNATIWSYPHYKKWTIPSGKLSHNYGKIHHFVAGKTHELSTGPFSIAILT